MIERPVPRPFLSRLALLSAAVVLPAAGAAGGTCSGTVFYTDRLFDISGFTATLPRPARYVDVFLYTSDLGTLLGQGATDGSGEFSFAVTDMGVRSVRLVAAADSDSSPWSERIAVYDDTSSPMVQSAASAAVTRDTSGSFTMDFTVPVAVGQQRTGDPFNIIDVLLDSAERVYGETGTRVPGLLVYWKDGSSDGTYYSPSGNAIHLLGGTAGSLSAGDNDGYDDCVIIHEYGHFLSFRFSEDDNPGLGHSSIGYYIPTLTWSEGWATFWNLAVRRSAVYFDSLSGDIGFTINFEDGYPNSERRVGMNNESAVAMVLYDLHDDAGFEDGLPGSDDEGYAFGLGWIWTVFDGPMDDASLLVTFLDFYRNWAALYAGVETEEAYVERGIEFAADATDSVFVRYPLNTAIPDGSSAGIADTMEISGFREAISEARVFVSVQHSSRGQLLVSVEHPDGTRVMLHSRLGGTEDNLIEWYGYSTYAVPAQDLGALAGKEINGAWKLVVADEVSGTTGRLKAWGVRLENAKPSNPQTEVAGPMWKAY